MSRSALILLSYHIPHLYSRSRSLPPGHAHLAYRLCAALVRREVAMTKLVPSRTPSSPNECGYPTRTRINGRCDQPGILERARVAITEIIPKALLIIQSYMAPFISGPLFQEWVTFLLASQSSQTTPICVCSLPAPQHTMLAPPREVKKV